MIKTLIITTLLFLTCLTLVIAQDTPPPFDKIKSIALLQTPDADGNYIAKRTILASGVMYWACYLPERKVVAIVRFNQSNTLAVEYWEAYKRFALYNDGDRVEISLEKAIELVHQLLLEANGMQSI